MATKKSTDAYYFAFSAKDWRSSESVQVMSLAERGAFIELLAVAWLSSDEPCSIPAEDTQIAALLHVTLDEWKCIAPRVLAEFDETTKSGRLRNDRLWNEYQRMKTEHRRKVQGGKTSSLRQRDERGRLLSKTLGVVLDAKNQDSGSRNPSSQSQSQSQSQRTTTTPKATTPATSRGVWMLPASRVWESRFGAGSFPWGEFGRHCKPLKGHHPPATIAEYLERYLSRTESQFVSSARFAKTFGEYKPVDANALVDEWGVLTALGEKETRPAGMRVA